MWNTKAAAKKFSQVISCDYCSCNNYPNLLRDDSFNLPQPGYIGTNYKNTRVLLVGQNPGVPTYDPSDPGRPDKKYADALITVRDKANAKSMARLKSIEDEIMPTWSVVQRQFPLAECGLQLDDIAYVNLVRCRTKGNAMPGSYITRACINNHFIGLLDWLQPRVVVCIGKWAHNYIGTLLKGRGIQSGFINRQRSLPTDERQRNKKQVVDLVRSVLYGKKPDVVTQSQGPETSRRSSVRVADADRTSVKALSHGFSLMDAEAYLRLFDDLSFDTRNLSPNNGWLLRHPRLSARLYFNRNREIGVYFTGYPGDSDKFPPDLWTRVPAERIKKSDHNLFNAIPMAGMERRAFSALLS